MDHALARLANMYEAILRKPELLPHSRQRTPAETAHRLRVIALLRSFTAEEVKALLREGGGVLPERLPQLAEAAGLPVDEARQVLHGIVWQLTEGVKFHTPQSEH